MENRPDGKVSSGLLFICFQKNIARGFEYIKKELLNNKNFPVPQSRKKALPEKSWLIGIAMVGLVNLNYEV